MKIISHRGNLLGSSETTENRISYIKNALAKFDVEFDIWKTRDGIYLGHDKPEYYLWGQDYDILGDKKSWIHTKNVEALDYMLEYHPNSNFFWHQNDDFTLTSTGFIWTYPGKQVTSKSIIVVRDLEEIDNYLQSDVYAICTDDPVHLQERLKAKDIEKRYGEYVYECACVEGSPMTFYEFTTK